MKSLALPITLLAAISFFWAMVLVVVVFCDSSNVASRAVGVASANWGEAIKALTSLLTVGIAALALRNWKRQSRTKIETDFLDSLIDVTTEYVESMSATVVAVDLIHIGMVSNVGPGATGELLIDSAVSYIQHDQGRDAKILNEYLTKNEAPLNKLSSLKIKGDVLGLPNYEAFKASCTALERLHSRIVTLAYMVGRHSGTNWSNASTRQILQRVIDIKDENVKKRVSAEKDEILKFARDNYRRLFW